MQNRALIALGLLALCSLIAWAEVRELVVDPMTSTEDWILGGRRINYVLGASGVGASAEQVRGDAETTLKLTYDFEEPRRDYLSAYYTGDPIPGRCEELSFCLFGNASGCGVRLAIEDARGRWFERDVGAIDWEGWRELRAEVGDGAAWRPLLRRGEERLLPLHPVCVRQIAVRRAREMDEPQASVYLHDLRARSDVVAADFVSAELATDREGNLFYVGEEVVVTVALSNRAAERVEGHLSATITDFFGREDEVDLGQVTVEANGALEKELRHSTDRLGTYVARLTLRSGDRERAPWGLQSWFHRFAVSRPGEAKPPDVDALFGCMFNFQGAPEDPEHIIVRLNRDAGLRWQRIGFGWGELNPAPGVWAWEGLRVAEGPVGQAAELPGQSFRAPHDPKLNCPDAVTIAFWAKGTGPNASWQWPIGKLGGDITQRNYGVYFSRRDGNFTFTAGFEGHPDRQHEDFGSGFSAWDGEWHHYAVTYSREAKEVTLYIDGEVKAAHDADGGRLRTNDSDLEMGTSCPASLDEMALYSRALTPAEVAALASGQAPPKQGLLAWWPFEEGGTTIEDRSGNGFDLRAEPSPERQARVALKHGIKTLGILGFPAQWASTAPEDASRSWVYKPKLDAWAEFVENVTRQYRDVVQHWEIWNEPNITVFWQPEPDAKEFFDVVRVGYEAAKRGNPDCTVMVPGLAGPGSGGWGMDFLDELIEMGAARHCDAISIHPYRQDTPEGSDLVGQLRHIAELCEQHGGRRPIWYTENCWTTHIPGGSTERRQALMLPRGYVLSLGTGLMERLLWFRLHDPGVDRFYTEHNYGMCYHDYTPKPAYFAHRTVATLLEGCSPDGAWDVGPQAMAHVFRTPAERVAAVWAPDTEAVVSLFIGQPTARVVDLMGNESEMPTEGGVLVLEAGEAVVFLRGLSDEAEGRGAPVELVSPALVRGAEAKLTLRLRNPFALAQAMSVSLQTPDGLSLAPASSEVTLPPNTTQELSMTASVAPDAKPGHHPIVASVALAGRTYTQELLVPIRCAAPDAGPVGHWKLDEGEGTAIGDSSPHANQGTVQEPNWVEGKRGTALQFDGQNIAVIPDSPSLNLPDEVTVAFWLKPLGDTGTWQFPVTKYFQENIRRNYGIYLTTGTLAPNFSASFERGSYVHSDIGTRAPLEQGQWHHLAATCSMFDRRVRIYINGEPVTDRAFDQGAMLLTTDPVRFGTGTVGAIDEVIVYPRVLSPEEVGELAK